MMKTLQESMKILNLKLKRGAFALERGQNQENTQIQDNELCKFLIFGWQENLTTMKGGYIYDRGWSTTQIN